MPSQLFEDLTKATLDTVKALQDGGTQCMSLCVEVTKNSSKNFNRVALHYEGPGLLATYECSIDGRKYDVMITPRKENKKVDTVTTGLRCETCNTNTEFSCEGCNEMLCDDCATEVTGEVAIAAIKAIYKIERPTGNSIRLCKKCAEKYTALTK